MQYFITKSNFIRITNKVKLDEKDVNQAIYKKKIFFFNRIDENKILSVKQFLINAENGFYEFVEIFNIYNRACTFKSYNVI